MGMGLGGLGRLGRMGRPAPGKGGGGYDADALALFSRFTTPPDNARKAVINTLIVSLKVAGVFAKLDALYLLAAADAQAARRNWIADQYNLVAVNSPTFAADRGYTGNASSAYLDTGLNPSSAVSLKFGLNSGVAGVWNRSARAAGAFSDMAARTSPATSWIDVQPRIAGDIFAHALNGAFNTSIANTNSQGHFTSSRTVAGSIQGYISGSLAGSASAAAASIPNANIVLLARGVQGGSVDAYSPDQLAAGYVGAGLSAGEVSALHSALNTYLQAVGAA